MHHIVLIAGLGSSLFWKFNPWSKWARDMKARFDRHYAGRKDVTVWAVSSDGAGEKPALAAIMANHAKGRLGTVVGGGHSNGDRDWLFMAQALNGAGIGVPYGFGIDMTLGELGAKVYGNTAHYDEFWAGLQTADFDASFKGTKRFFDVDKINGGNVGHTASASLPWVQNRIFGKVTEAVR